jgi:surface antigen
LAISSLFLPLLNTPLAHADPYDDQIKAAEAKITEAQAKITELQAKGDTLENKIAEIRQEISILQTQIKANEARNAQLKEDISAAQIKLDSQKVLLTEQVRKIHEEGDISIIQMIASSKSISDFVDKKEQRTQVRNKLNGLVQEVKSLKADLEKQQKELVGVINDQKSMNAQLNVKNDEAGNLLTKTRGEEEEYQKLSKIESSNKSRLLKEQADANAAALRAIELSKKQQEEAARASQQSGQPATPSGVVYRSSTGTPYGGYPSYYYNAPQDSQIDKWGMYNRECVSYTAFKVWQSGRYMPYWGGIGNANMWPANARREGIPMDGKPRVGDVAISMEGYYGHAMYVEGVNSDGTVHVSQFNYGVSGEYSEMTIYADGLYFIHFQ